MSFSALVDFTDDVGDDGKIIDFSSEITKKSAEIKKSPKIQKKMSVADLPLVEFIDMENAVRRADDEFAHVYISAILRQWPSTTSAVKKTRRETTTYDIACDKYHQVARDLITKWIVAVDSLVASLKGDVHITLVEPVLSVPLSYVRRQFVAHEAWIDVISQLADRLNAFLCDQRNMLASETVTELENLHAQMIRSESHKTQMNTLIRMSNHLISQREKFAEKHTQKLLRLSATSSS